MLDFTADPRKLEITLRHYEEGYTSQALTTAKLQAEIVHLKANIDYLEQCLAEERAQQKSEDVEVEVRSISTFSAMELLTLKRQIAPDHDQSHLREPSPEAKAGPSNPNLQKRAKSVVHVLVPPLSEDKKRAFPRAPLTVYEDGAHPTIPVPARSRARTSADAVDRLGDIPSLDVKVSDKGTCVTVNDRNLLYSSHEFQLWRPSKPGGPGLLLHPSPEQAWQGDVQTVFVALYMAKYRYAGEYRLTQDEPLSTDEFNALPLAAKQKWATHIAQTVQYKEIRVRIATRRDKAREATTQEVMTVANDTKNAFRGTVTAEDVLRAYERGDEVGVVMVIVLAVYRADRRDSRLPEDARVADDLMLDDGLDGSNCVSMSLGRL
uniref:Tetrathionate reductase subunit B (Tetrathionate reductase subunit TtrB) n=1 Tax=Ganoderma boninense TaxID=34458 RepID=A0A5K1K2G5_9APHY|nr:Tetrathionate reductase subunit B (Tetrathionate reductase subunit TtrB) [Ganoderma boninense]